jgi:23S rRNA (uracil1939-C5)-methyltransferase
VASKFDTVLSAQVLRLSHDGRGVAEVNGKTVFLFGALPQEQVMFRYIRRQRQFDEGIVVEVLEPSPSRIQPECIHADVCGGCRLQHLASSSQLDYKQNVLIDHLQHFGKLTPPQDMLTPLCSDPWGYRRKGRLSVRYVHKKNKLLVGFHEKQGRYVADLKSCVVLHPTVGKHLTELRVTLEQLSIREAIPQVEFAIGDNAAVLVLRHLQPLTDNDRLLLQEFARQHNIIWYLQPGNLSTIAPLDEPCTLTYDLPAFNLTLEFAPVDFVQINANINQKLVQEALRLLDVQPSDSILDLFCGLGNFSLPLARHAHSVVGVEGDISMVKKARLNAERNGINNINFYAADLSQDVSAMPWWKQKYDKLLLDPARAGAWEIVQAISQLKVKSILYVSCNPATFARDAGELVKHGYRLEKLGVLDMFPHTQHVESIALFTK